MSENRLEKSLLVSWIPLKKAFNPNRVKLRSIPVVRIVTDPEDHLHQHVVGLRNNKFTFIGTEQEDIRPKTLLTPSHFQLSEVLASQGQTDSQFRKLTIKLANLSESGYTLEIEYHYDGFEGGVARKLHKEVSFLRGCQYPRLKGFPSERFAFGVATLSSTPDDFALSKFLVDQLMGSKKETFFEIYHSIHVLEALDLDYHRNPARANRKWMLPRDGQPVDIPHDELTELCRYLLFGWQRHKRGPDWTPGLRLGSKYLRPPKDLRHLIVKDILHEYERHLRDAGMLECDFQSIEPADLTKIKFWGKRMSEQYQTDPKLLSALYSLSSRFGWSAEMPSHRFKHPVTRFLHLDDFEYDHNLDVEFDHEREMGGKILYLRLAQYVQWFAYLKEDLFDTQSKTQKMQDFRRLDRLERRDELERSRWREEWDGHQERDEFDWHHGRDELDKSSRDHRIDRFQDHHKSRDMSEGSALQFLLLAAIEPSSTLIDAQVQNLSLPCVRTERSLVLYSPNRHPQRFEVIQVSDVNRVSQSPINLLIKIHSQYEDDKRADGLQISDGQLHMVDRSYIQSFPIAEILKTPRPKVLTRKVHEIKRESSISFSMDFIAHVEVREAWELPNFYLECRALSPGIKKDLRLCQPAKTFLKITPVTSLHFFPKQLWYCVSFSQCNLALAIFVVRLEMPKVTLSRLGFSSFTQQQLDPLSMFVNHTETQ